MHRVHGRNPDPESALGLMLRKSIRGCSGALVLWMGLSVVPAVGFETPQDIILMLDNSGSMRKNDPQFLTVVAVRRFLEAIGGDTRVAVLAFDEDVRWLVPLTPLTDSSRPTLLESLDVIDYRGQLTDSPRAMERGIYELKVNGRPEAEKSIVFMTDGIIDTGDAARDLDRARWMQEDLAADAADAGVRIFGVAFTENADFQLIQALSQRTDGEYFRAYSAADIDGVFSRIISALDEPLGTSIAFESADESSVTEPEEAGDETIIEPDDEPGFTDALAALEEQALEPGGEAESAPLLPTLTDIEVTEDEPALPTVEEAEEVVPADASSSPEPGPETQADAAPTASVTEPTPAAARDTTLGAESAAKPSALERLVSPLVLAGVGAVVVLVVALVLILARRRKPKEPLPHRPKAFLNDIAGATERPSYELTDKLTVVGRMRGAAAENAEYVVIEESTIGRRHALIEFKDHCFWISDQGSLNGTFINGNRLEGEQRLKHGDRLRFHRHEFEFVMLEMFETDRTMLSETLLADISAELAQGEDATQPRASGAAPTLAPGRS